MALSDVQVRVTANPNVIEPVTDSVMELPAEGGAARVVDAIMDVPWAITLAGLRSVLAVASRATETPEAIAAKLGRPLENARSVSLREGIATIPVRGPLVRYANLFTAISGGTSMEVLGTDFMEAFTNPAIDAVILDIDSPGGMVNGNQELAELIFEARGGKPIVAHVSGLGASAAYWIASAADEIVAGETAILGSIGTMFTVRDTKKAEEKAGIRTIQITSNQSPKKNRDPMTKEGQADVQALADRLAEVFIESVARNRGVDRDIVITEFGQGGVFVGADAESAGLADRLATYEALHAELRERVSSRSTFVATAASTTNKENTMANKPIETPAADLTAAQIETLHPKFVASWKSEGAEKGAETENARITGIQALASDGDEPIVEACIKDLNCSVEDAAFKFKAAETARQEARQAARGGDEETIDPPNPLADADADSNRALARSIVARARHVEPKAIPAIT